MQKSGCEPTVTGTLWHIHRGWLGHHLTSTHRRREEQGSMNPEWLHTEVEFEILRLKFGGEFPKTKPCVWRGQMVRQREIKGYMCTKWLTQNMCI